MDIILVSDILVVVVVVENGGFDGLKTAQYFLVELDVVGYVEDINIRKYVYQVSYNVISVLYLLILMLEVTIRHWNLRLEPQYLFKTWLLTIKFTHLALVF